jgi:hypothetical protein
MFYYGQEERVEELNYRIEERNKPDAPLEVKFDMRPASTKRTRFPISNRSNDIKAETPIYMLPTYDPAVFFTPPVGNQGPLSGFKIDSESRLQNRFFALQRNGAGMQNQYIPSSRSDLYNVSVPLSPSDQPYPGLFKPYPKKVTSEVPDFVGYLQMSNKTFNNATRTQLRISDIGTRGFR